MPWMGERMNSSKPDGLRKLLEELLSYVTRRKKTHVAALRVIKSDDPLPQEDVRQYWTSVIFIGFSHWFSIWSFWVNSVNLYFSIWILCGLKLKIWKIVSGVKSIFCVRTLRLKRHCRKAKHIIYLKSFLLLTKKTTSILCLGSYFACSITQIVRKGLSSHRWTRSSGF